MSVFQRLFKPREVKAVLLALDFEERKLCDAIDQPLLGSYAGFRLIRSDIRGIVSSHPADVVLKVREGMAPRTVAYLLIANRTAQMLRSGRYHIYRGTLSMPGQSLFSLWSVATGELEAAGMHSPEEGVEGERDFRQQIKDVG
ncbi:hypothetical protein [Caballeronia mineralivorans]|uniref:hypothetical protein n=1 Tax=Caballeronia mineralivorans TaxID=2010198 RepID=UPI0023F43E90|nr:hypothetical protein [Caballeronia mineralivorans]MDB5789098.1 hypothetical protein [Caballeronia mineralivorans]